MNPDYQQLGCDLQTRLDVIADTTLRDENPTEQLKQLQEVSERITAWHQQFRKDIPAQLNHFLQQQSLSKALDYLRSESLA